ncbi:hypothetical protein OIV83_001411 [Microbotryomycetes sp. JL201]|nr:hypothetical protein OIV83_001411 [Microbotryomycetes sp. JL201]
MPQLVSDLTTNGHTLAVHAAGARTNGHSDGTNTPHAEAQDIDMTVSKLATNGSGGAAPSFATLWPGSSIDRTELIRLTLQTLGEMGLSSSAASLSLESGVKLEQPQVTRFRNGVLEGDWVLVEQVLLELPPQDLTDLKTIQFLVRQQKFLEVLEARETKKALLIMCGSPEDLRSRAGWDGKSGGSRAALLDALQNYISPSLMIPRRRLETLLEQAKEQQRRNCTFHCGDVPISLLHDCRCDPATFPSHTAYVLHEHTDEIWRLEFSHDGKWLATAGRDRTAIIWNGGFTVDKILTEHADHISCLSWSPDDSILLTAAEALIKMWNTETGACIATLSEHKYQIGALSWLPDGQGFVSGGMDSRVYFWDLGGNITGQLVDCPSRVIDMDVSSDGTKLVAVGRADTTSPSRGNSVQHSRTGTPSTQNGPPIHARHDKKISVFSLPDNKLLFESIQPNELTSVTISDDSRFAIEILYIDLRDGTIVRRFQGHDQGRFVLQSCFGGALQNFVMSGSGDGQIFVWHRDTGRLLHQLSGHGSGSVNAVAWNKRHPGGMFASASDDRTVRIWTVPLSAHTRALIAELRSAWSFLLLSQHRKDMLVLRWPSRRTPSYTGWLMLLTCMLLSMGVQAQDGPFATSVDASLTAAPPRPTAPFNATSFIQSLLKQSGASGVNATAQRATLTTTASSPVATGQRATHDNTDNTAKFLNTQIDPTFGVLGALLVLSGFALTIFGSRNRTSLFLICFWATAMVVALVILATGVQKANHPPPSTTRGLYLFASLASGAVVGAAGILWWQGAQYVCGAIGGFCIAMFLLALRPDGLIRVAWGKYVLLVGFATLGFALSCVPKLMYSTILFGSAALGATVLVLGIDCFTRSNLKEFYVYLVHVGVPKRITYFPHSNPILIELGVMAALFVAGIAFQLRFYRLLVEQANTLRLADKERTKKEDSEAARNAIRFNGPELAAWESKHGRSQLDDEFKTGNAAVSGTTEYLPRLNLATTMLSTGDSANIVVAPKSSQSAPLSDGWVKYLSSRQIFRPSANQSKAITKPNRSAPIIVGRNSSSTNSATPAASSTPLSSSQGSFPNAVTSSSGASPALNAPAGFIGSRRSSAFDSSQDSVPLAQQVLQSYTIASKSVAKPKTSPVHGLRDTKRASRQLLPPPTNTREDRATAVDLRSSRPRRYSDSAEQILRGQQHSSDDSYDDRRRPSFGDQLDQFAAAQRRNATRDKPPSQNRELAAALPKRLPSGLPLGGGVGGGPAGSRPERIRQSPAMPSLSRQSPQTETERPKKHSWLDY